MPPRVFISHSTKDKEVANAICRCLESERIECWIAPRDIKVGTEWSEAIMRGIETCRAFILVLSANARNVEKLQRAIGFLEEAVRLDPKFTLAYCAMTKAHDLLYEYDPTSERLASGDTAINRALSLQPDLPEVQLAYAYHLYFGWSDYDRARLHQ
jgi:tetratricopeptide (TPR) repeat protein